MNAYEMMLSESQERMLMVLKPEKEAEAKAIFAKWGLDFAVVGYTTDTLRFVVKHHGEVMADLPIKELGDEAPLYDRPHVPTAPRPLILATDIPESADLAGDLLKLIGSPDHSSRRWVYEQYDYLIQGNTLQRPGGDAGVIRVEEGPKGLAFSTDVTPRYCEADPVEGGRQAVAECYRNLTATGALPLAITDNLNFGNPEKPEIMGQLVGCIRGIGEACRALDFPVVSGNVSLYNETNGRAILPTPTIGGVGLLEDFEDAVSIAFKGAGEAIVLISGNAPAGHMGSTAYLATVLGREEGAPPPVDLLAEKRAGDFVRSLITRGLLTACHDVSDGGLAVALAEMAMAGKIGAKFVIPNAGVPPVGFLFGEDQARYVLTIDQVENPGLPQKIVQAAKAAGLWAAGLGITGGDDLECRGLAMEDCTLAGRGGFKVRAATTRSICGACSESAGDGLLPRSRASQ
jgi:phosphoribosylformylglycinamidine synthase